MKTSVNWFICQLHGNELPLRHLIRHLDGATQGPKSLLGPIGKQLSTCETLRLVDFKIIATDVPTILKTNLSSDQAYLYNMVLAVSSGVCSESLKNSNPGKMVHSRWLTTANRILRLYISTADPTENLIILAEFIMKVYAPMWFTIKCDPSCLSGAKHLHKSIQLSRYLPTDVRKIVDNVIKRNAFFGHHENILLSMLTDERSHIRQLAFHRIKKVSFSVCR